MQPGDVVLATSGTVGDALWEKSSLEGVLAAPVSDTAHADDRRAFAVRGLARLGKLAGAPLARATNDPAPVVRLHLMKTLAAMPGWDAARGNLVRAKLADSDPFVRRAISLPASR